MGTKGPGVVAITLPVANSIHKGEAVTILDTAVDVNTGDTLLGLTWTQYGEGGGSGSFVRNATDNGWTVPANTINGEGDVIISAQVVTDAKCTVTVTNNTGLQLLGAKYEADGTADGAAAAVTAAAVTIKPDGSYVIQAAPGTKLACEVTTGATLCTVEGEGTEEITIKNVLGTVEVTLTVVPETAD
ncbi:MAG: hypothetical protein K2O45_11655 [Oscillospiraceae bacterium]|nr:hypothetical protein [Oscillospiraceae bacterium]